MATGIPFPIRTERWRGAGEVRAARLNRCENAPPSWSNAARRVVERLGRPNHIVAIWVYQYFPHLALSSDLSEPPRLDHLRPRDERRSGVAIQGVPLQSPVRAVLMGLLTPPA